MYGLFAAFLFVWSVPVQPLKVLHPAVLFIGPPRTKKSTCVNFALSGFQTPSSLKHMNRPGLEDCTLIPSAYFSKHFQLVFIDSPGISNKFSVDDITQYVEEMSDYLPSEIVSIFYFVPPPKKEGDRTIYDWQELRELLRWRTVEDVPITVVNLHIPQEKCKTFIYEHVNREFPESDVSGICVKVPSAKNTTDFVRRMSTVSSQMNAKLSEIKSLLRKKYPYESVITTGELIKRIQKLAKEELEMLPRQPDSQLLDSGILTQVVKNHNIENWLTLQGCDPDTPLEDCLMSIVKTMTNETPCTSLHDCGLLMCSRTFNDTSLHAFSAFIEQIRDADLPCPSTMDFVSFVLEYFLRFYYKWVVQFYNFGRTFWGLFGTLSTFFCLVGGIFWKRPMPPPLGLGDGNVLVGDQQPAQQYRN